MPSTLFASFPLTPEHNSLVYKLIIVHDQRYGST